MAAEEVIAAAADPKRESLLIELCERGWIPDRLTRMGIRRLLRTRLHDEGARDPAVYEARKSVLIEQLRNSPIALSTRAANAQHYEVPTEFFLTCLGPHLKYSSCLYPHTGTTLEQAEAAMLALSCERAALADGMRILELGCGWGSLSLWLAEQYPRSQIVAVSNSRSQREFIESRCRDQGLQNLQIITADMQDFAAQGRFDRVLSVEMFEHMRNYEFLLRRIANWLEPSGRLFVHIFCHRNLAYPFCTAGADDWMSRHFFTDGLMPSFDLLLHFQRDLRLEQRWWVNGRHYARTCEDWLRNCDAARDRLLPMFARDSGIEPDRERQRWRMFFLACAELFAFGGGNEWGVGHYLFTRP
ncbi:MAG: SAM-dependent methyltransferase [Nevskiales bacterium]